LQEIDEYAVVKYNSFDNITHYYSEMSAMGDFQSFQNTQTIGRISNVSRPFLVVHALDDPLITWKVIHDPDKLVNTGKGNVVILITNSGGHVGWPMGLLPNLHGWGFMNGIVKDFVDAIENVT